MTGILHFGDIRAGAPDWDADRLLGQFKDGFSQFVEGDRSRIELIVVSGSITENAKAEEFEAAAKFLEDIARLVFPDNNKRQSGVRIFPTPGLLDARSDGGATKLAEFEQFLHRFVPKTALLGSCGQHAPYVLKLRAFSLLGLRPAAEKDNLAFASSQLLKGIRTLEGFCYRQDLVPKIVVSSGSELARGDSSLHAGFRTLCDALRAAAPLDLHLATHDETHVIGPHPFGMPVPSVVSGRQGSGTEFAVRRLNLINYLETGSGTQFSRKTFLTSVSLVGTVWHPHASSGRIGQPLQIYEGRRRAPDFCECLEPIVADVSHAIFHKGKRLIAIEGLQGSGKRILYRHLEEGNWLPPDQRHFRMIPMIIDADPLAWPEGNDNSILIILDEKRRTLRGVELHRHGEQLSHRFESIIPKFRAIIYLFMPSDSVFNPGNETVKQVFLRISLSKIDRNKYNDLVAAVSRYIEIDKRDILAQLGGQIALVDRFYNAREDISPNRYKTRAISPEESRKLLELYARVPAIEAAASGFVESLGRTHGVAGLKFAHFVRRGLGSKEMKLRSCPLQLRWDPPSGTAGRRVGQMLKELEEFDILTMNDDQLTVNAPFPFYAARILPVVQIMIVRADMDDGARSTLARSIGAACEQTTFRVDCGQVSNPKSKHLLLSCGNADSTALAEAGKRVRDWVEENQDGFLGEMSLVFVCRRDASRWTDAIQDGMIVKMLIEIEAANDEEMAFSVIDRLVERDEALPDCD